MKLEKAIKYYKDIIKECRDQVDYMINELKEPAEETIGWKDCADEYEYIVQWLTELKERREQNPFKIVLEDLCKINMFTGKYDAKNGNKYFIYGIWAVMEYIACKIDEETQDELNSMFCDNMEVSENDN